MGEHKKTMLCADIGGTNANFSITGFRNSRPEILLLKRYSSQGVKDFPGLVNGFLEYAKKEKNLFPGDACFAAAGPVRDQKVKLTNADIVIDAKEIMKKTGLRHVCLINDFEAVSYATNILQKKDVVIINRGKPAKMGTRAVIGAGTGLGKSFLAFNDCVGEYISYPSEGGHSDLPLSSEEEIGLAKSIAGKEAIVYEDVLSGRGLENIYRSLRKGFPSSPKNLPAKEISATRKTDPCSRETFRMFIRFYARCCRNFALEVLATGGMYILGGIAANNADAFSKGFFDEFTSNATYRHLLEDIPVYIITDYDISLLGAAYYLDMKKKK